MAFPLRLPHDGLSERQDERARRHPERETLEFAAAGAAKVLGPDHGATMVLAKAAISMSQADLCRSRLAVKTLRLDQREAIAEVVED